MIFAELDLDTQKIIVRTAWAEKDQIKSIPGARWSPQNKIWSVPLSWGACKALRHEFGMSLHVGTELALWSRTEHDSRIGPSLTLQTVMNDSTILSVPITAGIATGQRWGEKVDI